MWFQNEGFCKYPVDTLWALKFHCKSPPSYSPHLHTEQHIAKQRFCAEDPSIPTPVTSKPCLTPLTPTKQKALDSWLGSNIYRLLRIELETSDDFKKNCLGQKESLCAQDVIRKIKVKIRQHELSLGLNALEVRDAGVLVKRARGLNQPRSPHHHQGRSYHSFTAANHACPLSHLLEVQAKLLPPHLGWAHT